MPALDLAPDLICCNAAIGACARAGEPARAEHVLRQVLVTSGVTPDTKSYNGLLTAHANAQPAQWQGALETLEAMLAAGEKPYPTQTQTQSPPLPLPLPVPLTRREARPVQLQRGTVGAGQSGGVGARD